MWAFSSAAPTNSSPNVPLGTLDESKACSVTIQTYPLPVMFKRAASLNIWSASVVLQKKEEKDFRKEKWLHAWLSCGKLNKVFFVMPYHYLLAFIFSKVLFGSRSALDTIYWFVILVFTRCPCITVRRRHCQTSILRAWFWPPQNAFFLLHWPFYRLRTLLRFCYLMEEDSRARPPPAPLRYCRGAKDYYDQFLPIFSRP